MRNDLNEIMELLKGIDRKVESAVKRGDKR